jgi:hypothetical protein
MSGTIRFVAVVAFVGVTGALTATTLDAQGAALLTNGARIRVTLTSTPRKALVGTFDALSEDTLHLRVRRESPSRTPVFDILGIPLAGIEALEVSRGRHANAGRGALIGLGVGAGLGVLVGAAGGCAVNVEATTPDRAGCAALGGLTLGLSGAGLGALIGALSTSDEWVTVPLSSLGPAPVTPPGTTVSHQF